MSLPTPAELATFLKAIDYTIDDALPGLKSILEEEKKCSFRGALQLWSTWTQRISGADQILKEVRKSDELATMRHPVAEVMKNLGSLETIKSYWFPGMPWNEAFPGTNQTKNEIWQERMKNGIYRYEVLQMQYERQYRAQQRAKKGGLARAKNVARK
jgi:hypothetical protein